MRSWYGQVSNEKPPTMPNTSVGLKSPIRGSWLNLGNFSPGVATDIHHKKGHNGIDMMAQRGTPIYAAGPGVARPAPNAMGGPNSVSILHGNGLKTYYAHLDKSNISAPVKVDANTVIGYVGNTGNASGTYPHLHFEVSQNGTPINPGNFFTVPKYDPNINKQFMKKFPS